MCSDAADKGNDAETTLMAAGLQDDTTLMAWNGATLAGGSKPRVGRDNASFKVHVVTIVDGDEASKHNATVVVNGDDSVESLQVCTRWRATNADAVSLTLAK